MTRAGRMTAVGVGMLLAGVANATAGAGAPPGAMQPSRPAAAEGRGGRAAASPVARLGPWIRGIVVDERGRPVAGARVWSLWSVGVRPVVSRADGTFVLASDRPRLLNQAFLATAGDGAWQGIFRFDGPSGFKGPRTLARIVLRPARIVTVIVVDGRGAPVPGAAVFALDVISPVAQGRTDARGIAMLRAPAEAMMYWIYGCKPGVGFDYFENVQNRPAPRWPPPPELARLVLDGARTIRVRVVDSAGRPVPDAELYPWTILKAGKRGPVNLAGYAMKVRSDQRGYATFDWLPADIQPGTSFLLASFSYLLRRSVPLDPAQPGADLTARVLRSARVSGKLTLPDGSPASGILVEAQGAGGARPLMGMGRARTDADGSYAMDLPAEQSYMICVSDDEWAARSLSGVVVREGVPQSGLDLALERGAVIRGRATVGPDSRPLAGRPVILVEQGPFVPPGTLREQPVPLRDEFARLVDTDEDGRYAFRVAPGRYELRSPHVSGEADRTERIDVAVGQEIERNFTLARDDRP